MSLSKGLYLFPYTIIISANFAVLIISVVVLKSFNDKSLAVSTLIFKVLIVIGVLSNSFIISKIASLASDNSTK